MAGAEVDRPNRNGRKTHMQTLYTETRRIAEIEQVSIPHNARAWE